MAEIPTAIEAFIAIMEIDLLQEFETLMVCPLIPNPFWLARILLVRGIQGKIQTAQGIRDAMETIHRGKQESVAGFRLIEQIAQNLLVNPSSQSSNLENTPTNSLASAMQPPQEDLPHNPPSEVGS